MTLLLRGFRPFDISLISKHCSVISKNSWNIEFPFSDKKVDVPPPPKKPLTSFFIFCKEKRKDLLNDQPSLSAPQQMKILAAQWGSLGTEMKQKYEAIARKDTIAYGEKHKKFYENLTEAQKQELKRLTTERKDTLRLIRMKRELKLAGIPKRGGSAYTIFVQSIKSSINDKHGPEFIKEAARMWKALPIEEKKLFEEQAEEDKKQYLLRLEEWKEKLASEGNDKLLRAYKEWKGDVNVPKTSPNVKKKGTIKEK